MNDLIIMKRYLDAYHISVSFLIFFIKAKIAGIMHDKFINFKRNRYEKSFSGQYSDRSYARENIYLNVNMKIKVTEQ